jgi:hypothetical protein
MDPPPDRSVWNSAMPMQNVVCCAREDCSFPSAGLTRITADEMRQQKHERVVAGEDEQLEETWSIIASCVNMVFYRVVVGRSAAVR